MSKNKLKKRQQLPNVPPVCGQQIFDKFELGENSSDGKEILIDLFINVELLKMMFQISEQDVDWVYFIFYETELPDGSKEKRLKCRPGGLGAAGDMNWVTVYECGFKHINCWTNTQVGVFTRMKSFININSIKETGTSKSTKHHTALARFIGYSVGGDVESICSIQIDIPSPDKQISRVVFNTPDIKGNINAHVPNTLKKIYLQGKTDVKRFHRALLMQSKTFSEGASKQAVKDNQTTYNQKLTIEMIFIMHSQEECKKRRLKKDSVTKSIWFKIDTSQIKLSTKIIYIQADESVNNLFSEVETTFGDSFRVKFMADKMLNTLSVMSKYKNLDGLSFRCCFSQLDEDQDPQPILLTLESPWFHPDVPGKCVAKVKGSFPIQNLEIEEDDIRGRDREYWLPAHLKIDTSVLQDLCGSLSLFSEEGDHFSDLTSYREYYDLLSGQIKPDEHPQEQLGNVGEIILDGYDEEFFPTEQCEIQLDEEQPEEMVLENPQTISSSDLSNGYSEIQSEPQSPDEIPQPKKHKKRTKASSTRKRTKTTINPPPAKKTKKVIKKENIYAQFNYNSEDTE
jgi:hypothetical protein